MRNSYENLHTPWYNHILGLKVVAERPRDWSALGKTSPEDLHRMCKAGSAACQELRRVLKELCASNNPIAITAIKAAKLFSERRVGVYINFDLAMPLTAAVGWIHKPQDRTRGIPAIVLDGRNPVITQDVNTWSREDLSALIQAINDLPEFYLAQVENPDISLLTLEESNQTYTPGV